MNAMQLFAFTLLTAVAGAAFAGEVDSSPASDVSSSLQRVEVKAEVARAMRDGTLMRAGEASGQYIVPPITPKSMLTREAVKAEVIRARLDGTLLGAGEPSSFDRSLYDTRSTLARADVKAQVVQARLDGTLLRAGEAYFGGRPIGIAPGKLAQARIAR